MFNVIRRSQIIGLTAMDNSTATRYGSVEEVWIKGFLSEKSQQVKNLVKRMGDRLHSLVSTHDQLEVVHVKIKEVKDELAKSGQHDKNALEEASEFLQDKWEDLQHSLSRTGKRMKQALDSAWKRLTHSS